MTLPSGGVTLREHLEGRIDALRDLFELHVSSAERAVQIAMAAAKEASSKAEVSNEHRFDSVNEFRTALNDLVTGLMPRAESEQRHAAAREKIDLMVPRSEAMGHWKTFTDKLDLVDGRLTRIEGAGMGVRGAWAVIIGLIAAATAAIGTAVAILR